MLKTYNYLYTEKAANGCTSFLLDNDKQLNKWIKQNNGTITETFCGCLVDNYLVETKHGIAAVYESYLNEWCSCYRVYFARNGSEAVFKVLNGFYQSMDQAEQEAEEENARYLRNVQALEAADFKEAMKEAFNLSHAEEATLNNL